MTTIPPWLSDGSGYHNEVMITAGLVVLHEQTSRQMIRGKICDLLFIPLSRMQKLALEFLQSRNLRPRNLVQLPTSSNHDVHCLLERLGGVRLLDFDRPLLRSCIPDALDHLVLTFGESGGAKFLGNVLQILLHNRSMCYFPNANKL